MSDEVLKDQIVRAAVRLVLIGDGYVQPKSLDEQQEEMRKLVYEYIQTPSGDDDISVRHGL